MKLNHYICPNCGHDFYDEAACTKCDACQCNFYASQSKTVTLCPSNIRITGQLTSVPYHGNYFMGNKLI